MGNGVKDGVGDGVKDCVGDGVGLGVVGVGLGVVGVGLSVGVGFSVVPVPLYIFFNHSTSCGE